MTVKGAPAESPWHYTLVHMFLVQLLLLLEGLTASVDRISEDFIDDFCDSRFLIRRAVHF